MDYCSPSDLYAFGVPRGRLSNSGRLVGSVSAADDTIALDDHDFFDGDPITFRAEAGGSLASPLREGVTYYARSVTREAFKVALTATGDAIDLTTSAVRMLVIAAMSREAAITYASSLIDDMLPAHVVPLTSVPPIVRMTCAELAAAKLGFTSGTSSKSLTEMADAARKRVERWASGFSIRGTNAPESAVTAQVAIAPYNDARGWSRFGGIG